MGKDNGKSTDAADAATSLAKEAEESSASCLVGGSEDPKKRVPKDSSENKEPEKDEPEKGEAEKGKSEIGEPEKDEPEKDEPKEQEAKEEEPKAKKVESTGKDGSSTNTENSRRGKRVRKSTENYTVEDKPQKEKEIPKGQGEKLEEMPNVVANFKAITWSSPHLHDLYSIVFGQGKKKQFKGHLLQFNGVVFPEGKDEAAEKDKILARMYKLKMDELKAVMDLADIDRSATASVGSETGVKVTPGKEALCDRFLEWLENPTASGKTIDKKKGKRKSTGSTKKVTPAKKARKITPSKKTSAKKEKSSEKKATPKTVKAAPKSPKAKASKPIDLNIPGVDIDKVKAKVESIVENADKSELTVKGVRKMLEDWLDTDLTDHKDAIRSIVMEVM